MTTFPTQDDYLKRLLSEWADSLRYRGPEINAEGVRLEKFEVSPDHTEFWRHVLSGRGCRPGTYHRLIVDDTLWMSDTDAECADHLAVIAQAHLLELDEYDDGRVGKALVNGLGMGCVVGALTDICDHIDVVESDERIIKTVGAWYMDKYGDQITIHHGDAMTFKFPDDARWDVAWHDIWPNISDLNLAPMSMLMQRYEGRVKWQDCWARPECEQFDAYLKSLEAEARAQGWTPDWKPGDPR